LPARLTEKYSLTVGGVLGAGDLQATVFAGVLALAVILTFVAAYYRVPGLVGAFTLLVYLWLMLGAFVLLQVTLSLAAIVALVLGVGIAADSNILAFERFKEELRKREEPSEALRESSRSALQTILEANATTFIAALVLFAAPLAQPERRARLLAALRGLAASPVMTCASCGERRLAAAPRCPNCGAASD